MIKMLFWSEVPDYVRKSKDKKGMGLGFCGERRSSSRKWIVVIIDNTLLCASLHQEGEMYNLINFVPIHEFAHSENIVFPRSMMRYLERA